MRTASQCLKMLSNRKHSVWLQKLSETTYVADLDDLMDLRAVGVLKDTSHIPPGFWRGRIRQDKWHYGSYTAVLNALVENALAKEVSHGT